jgi:hypothetical protein
MRRLATAALLVALLAAVGLRPAHAQIIYVDKDASGNNDGTSWTDAFTDLQDAINDATASDEIWIAQGTYNPDSEGDSFKITGGIDGVKVYGGFESGDAFGDRDPTANKTILSGDLSGDDTDPDNDGIVEDADPDDDGTAANLSGTNAEHVLILDGGNGIDTDEPDITAATRVEGIYVTAGQADGSSPDGGGLYCDGQGSGNRCNPTLENVVFSGNAAGFGGALYNEGDNGTSSPTIEGSTFQGNVATSDGGAVFNDGGGTSSPDITSSTTFVDNSAGNDAGVIYSDGSNSGTSSPVIENATFTGNSANDDGGALYNDGSDSGTSNPEITGSTFENNTAGEFNSNTTTAHGGAIFNDGRGGGTSSPVIKASTFADNSAANDTDQSNGDGGAIFNNVGNSGTISPRIINTTFTGNEADDGGAIANLGPDMISSEIINSTFTENSALGSGGDGGAIDNGANGGTISTTIENTILWGNTAGGSGPEIHNDGSGATPTLSHTIVEGGLSGVSENNGSSTTYLDDGGSSVSFDESTNFNQDPLFVDASNPDGSDGTVRTVDDGVNVKAGSPALDGGDNSAVSVTTDITGASRTQELDNYDAATVNIGAYEAISGGFSQRIVGTDGTENDADWRMLSVPAAGATRGALSNDVTFSTSSGNMLYRWGDDQWVAQRNSDALPRGTGFILYFFDDSTDPLTSRGIVLGVPDGGADRTADVTVSSGIEQSHEFEVLGNPYNVAYDLGSLAGGDLPSAGFQATVQVWNPETQQFKAFTQGMSGDEIPAWNGFVLERMSIGSGQGSLTFGAGGKQSGSGSFVGSKATSAENTAHAEVAVQLAVTGTDGDTTATDRAVLWLDDRAGQGWDGYEATDYPPPVSNSYATAAFPIDRDGENVQRMLASEPYPEGGETEISIPLSVGAVGVSGTATLFWPEALREEVPSGWTVELQDTETGKTIDLRAAKHTFSLGEKRARAKASGARFRLKVRSSPLPVELAGFQGTIAEEEVALQWRTASETNNSGFRVERKARERGDESTWTEIGFVASRAKSGTTDQPRTYRFRDANLPYAADTLRYRLRQVGTDGSAALTESVTIARHGPDRLKLLGTAPNPARSQATVRYAVPEESDASEVTMRLYDVLGRAVRSVPVTDEPGRHEQVIDVSRLSSGVYVLRLTAGGQTQTRKLTVVR